MPHVSQTVNYSLVRGLPWERLIIVKNRYNRSVLKPTDARAYIKTGTTSKSEITASLTKENGISLSLSAEETQDLPLGDLQYDVLATINGVQRPVANGTITVTALDNITPLETAQSMEIRYRQRTDYRRTFTWKDAEGDIVNVQSAYMQAKDAEGNTVLDLRWFATVPNEATIIALSVEQRGYLAPATGATLEMHISNANTISTGTYDYDLFVQNSVSGDWDIMVSGSLVVESSISTPPA